MPRFAIGWAGVLGLTGVLLGPQAGLAQVQGDGSLGSVVNGSLTNVCVGLCGVTGGANPQTGPNLFHSFRQFSLPNGDTVQFSVTPNVENLLVRVTGVGPGFVSDINGTIQTVDPSLTQFQPVNFFLLNPNGIVFGPGAKLNVGGAVVATTAERVTFQDGTVFSTQDGTPLLTVSVPTGLQFGAQPGELRVRGVDWLGGDRNAVGFTYGNLALVGGNVGIENAQIRAINGELRIASLGSFGTVDLQANGGLSIPDNPLRNNVSLQNSEVIILGDGVNDITLTARQIDIDNSFLLTGRSSNLAVSDNSLGAIRLDATEEVLIRARSFVGDVILPGQSGAGSVMVNTRILELREGSQIATSNSGTGDAGDIRITATDRVRFQGTSADGLRFSGVRSLFSGSSGKSGDVVIDTAALEILDGAQLFTRTTGLGNAGDIRVAARDSILLGGTGPGNGPTAISSQVGRNAQGQGGNLVLNTRALAVLEGSQIGSIIFGQGRAGNVEITATDRIRVQGQSIGGNASSISTSVQPGGQGTVGDLLLNTAELEVLDGAEIDAATFGVGDAGTLRIRASDRIRVQGGDGQTVSSIGSGVQPSGQGRGGEVLLDTTLLELLDGGQISAATAGIGDAGTLRIQASDRILLRGPSSLISSNVESTATGSGGAVLIETGSLDGIGGAQIFASTSGKGNAGTVSITARDRVRFQGAAQAGVATGIFSRVNAQAVGQGGEIVIEVPILEISGGAGISASTFGAGDAGNVRITAGDPSQPGKTGQVLLSGSNLLSGNPTLISSSSDGSPTGQAGEVQITTHTLMIADGAAIDVGTANDRPAGDIILSLRRLELLNGGQILSSSEGNRSSGNAGSIRIDAADSILVTGRDSNFTNRVQLTPNLSLFYFPESTIAVRSTGTGAAGDLSITTPILSLDDRGQLIADSNATSGGNITLNLSDALIMGNGSLISATAGRAQGAGDGGNIRITAPFVLSLPGENNDIIANAFSGTGGNITINADAILNFTVNDFKDFDTLRAQPTNDISASSQLGTQGVLNLQGLDVDPSQGAIALPRRFAPPDQVRDRCKELLSPSGRNYRDSFVITGRGGMAETPETPRSLPSDPPPWITLPPIASSQPFLTLDNPHDRHSAPHLRVPSSEFRVPTSPQPPLVEATAIQRHPDGRLELIAAAPLHTRTERPCDLERQGPVGLNPRPGEGSISRGRVTSPSSKGLVPPNSEGSPSHALMLW